MIRTIYRNLFSENIRSKIFYFRKYFFVYKVFQEKIIESKNLNKKNNFKLLKSYEIKQPLMLITQLTRSGGSLLSQLLDGHTEYYSFPDELKLNSYSKFDWPSLNNTKSVFRTMYSPRLHELSTTGFHKGKDNRQRLKFNYSLYHQNIFFNKKLKQNKNNIERDILDIYFSSFFSSWFNYRDNNSKKKFITGFWPMLCHKKSNLDLYFRIYPDGKIISIFRDPVSWYISAKNHKSTSQWFVNIEEAASLWNQTNKQILEAHRNYKEKVLIIKFEELIKHTEKNMKKISKFLKISFQKSMLKPTFNGEPVESNSSFKTSIGIDRKVISRNVKLLKSEKDYLRNNTKYIFNELIKLT